MVSVCPTHGICRDVTDRVAAPYAWLLGGEYPNTAIRGYAFGFATALNFLGNWLGTFTAPYFINPAALGWSAQYGYIWFGSNMVLFVFTWFFIPETRGECFNPDTSLSIPATYH